MTPHRPQIVTAGAVLLIVTGATVLTLELGLAAWLTFAHDGGAPCTCIISPCCFGIGWCGIWLVRAGTNILNGSIASLPNIAGIAGGIGTVLTILFGLLFAWSAWKFFRDDRTFDEDSAMEFGALLFPFFLSGAVAASGFLLIAGAERYTVWVRSRPLVEPEPPEDGEPEADPPETDD